MLLLLLDNCLQVCVYAFVSVCMCTCCVCMYRWLGDHSRSTKDDQLPQLIVTESMTKLSTRQTYHVVQRDQRKRERGIYKTITKTSSFSLASLVYAVCIIQGLA